MSECRTVPPTRFPNPYAGAQAATCSHFRDYVDFGSGPPPPLQSAKNITVPGSYLRSTFIVQSAGGEDDVWITDSDASCHMTHDRTRIYNMKPPPPVREKITIRDRRKIKVEYIGNMDVIVHGKTDQRITLIDVAYVPGFEFNLCSLHAVQRTHRIGSHASGKHTVGANLMFLRSSIGLYLRATRLPAGTVRARRRQGNMRATKI